MTEDKLKTLKEIAPLLATGTSWENGFNVAKKELREEARKWVKHIEEAGSVWNNPHKHQGRKCIQTHAQTEILKIFFNLEKGEEE